MILEKGELRKLQQIELQTFKVFIDVCEKLNIKYYLIAGTLLGAVRHKGFIPWDDDIDVGIMRDDYERFLIEAPKLLPDHLFLQTYKSDNGYPQIFAKIRNNNTAFIETSVQKNKMNHGIFIDIFPLDYCDLKKRKSFSFKIKEKFLAIRSTSLFSNMKLSLKAKIARIISCVICPSLKQSLSKREDLYRSMQNCNHIINFSGVYGEREIMPKEWYGDGEKLNFEGLEVTVPKFYEKWLSQVYGNYMQFPPVEKRVTHHDTIIIDTEKSYLDYMES